MDRLLKSIADPELRPLINRHLRNILSVKNDLTGGRPNDSHDDLDQRRFAAAVRTSDRYETVIARKVDILQDLLVFHNIVDIFQFKHFLIPSSKYPKSSIRNLPVWKSLVFRDRIFPFTKSGCIRAGFSKYSCIFTALFIIRREPSGFK